MIAASRRTMVAMTSTRERRGLDEAAVRDHFPALGRTIDGVPVAFLEGPGGTQVPRECIADSDFSMSDCLLPATLVITNPTRFSARA